MLRFDCHLCMCTRNFTLVSPTTHDVTVQSHDIDNTLIRYSYVAACCTSSHVVFGMFCVFFPFQSDYSSPCTSGRSYVSWVRRPFLQLPPDHVVEPTCFLNDIARKWIQHPSLSSSMSPLGSMCIPISNTHSSTSLKSGRQAWLSFKLPTSYCTDAVHISMLESSYILLILRAGRSELPKLTSMTQLSSSKPLEYPRASITSISGL